MPLLMDGSLGSCFGVYSRKGKLMRAFASLQINNLGTSLLSLRLLPLMVDTSSEPRLVIVTSDVHYFAKVDEEIAAQPGIWKNLSSEEYCTSK